MGESLIQPSQSLQVSCDTVLQCLVVAARHHGVHLAADQLIREHGLSTAPLDTAQLAAIASAAGLELGDLQIAGKNLTALRNALPAVLVLRNGNALLLLELGETTTGMTATLYDPTVGEATPLIVEIERLADAITGHVFLVKKTSCSRDEAANQPFGFGRMT